eukprot:CAMPEP_0202350914 /NCGR_PEP_ID=MMETSP1126-20121109/7785_1 /ASSEMBLY_ACC=CAM_ASM_000457 /TAXON_ID=3047 /ORGANISM="Dunaliella tertiolecta, Strain CCMP1320" /LENGTH=71 /DNA_ID=CAMNT_0048942959 /DNA_START=798 /DNA_END=1013 /DNA_ORIENTATION=+
MSCTSFAGAGCGEACGPLMLILIAVLAVIGLAVSIPAAISFLYEKVDQAAGKTVEMVENVPTHQKSRCSEG